MKSWVFLTILVAIAATCALPELSRYWPAASSVIEIDYTALREPTPTLCISEDGNAATYLVVVPEYVGFTGVEKAALIKQHLTGYCEHIKSL